MKILVVHPGHGFSTDDCARGLIGGLEDLGHTVIEYKNDVRLKVAGMKLAAMWDMAGKSEVDKPSFEGVMYEAGCHVYDEVLRHDCQAVVVINGELFHPAHAIKLRKLGIPVGLWLTESPYRDEFYWKSAACYDIVWTNERSTQEVYARNVALQDPCNTRAVHYLPTGFNPREHFPRESDANLPAHDVLFVGSGFIERVKMLAGVDWTGIDMALYGVWAYTGSRTTPKKLNATLGRRWRAWQTARRLMGDRDVSHLVANVRGPVMKNRDAVALYKRAKINIDLGRTTTTDGRSPTHVPMPESMGPRMKELAAIGAFTIAEWRPEIEDTFGALVPTFRTPAELEALVRYWIDRPAEREALAAQLPDAVQAFSYRDIAEQLVAHLDRHLQEVNRHVPVLP